MTFGSVKPGRFEAPPGIARHRVIALALQLVHCAWFASTLDDGFEPSVLVASGFIALVLYAGFLVAEYRWNGYRVTPLLFYLAAGVFRLGVGALFVAAAVLAGEWALVRIGIYDVSRVLGYGHWLMLLGDWCFIAGYVVVSLLVRRDYLEPESVSSQLWDRVARTGMTTAVMALLLRLGENYLSLGGVASLASYLIDYGVAAGAFLMLFASRHMVRQGQPSTLYSPVAYFLIGLSLVDALFSYMKTEVLISILPLIVLGFERGGDELGQSLRSRLFRPIIGTTMVLYVFFFVVSSYSSSRRPDFWGVHSGAVQVDRYTVPVAPHLIYALQSAIPGTSQFRDAHQFPYGAWQMIGRMSTTPVPAWIYQEVETSGFRRIGFMEELFLSVTPRILWPDKPLVRHGVEFAVMTGQGLSVDSATTSMAMTLQGAWYWRGGYPWLIAGCVLSGGAFALAWLLFRNEVVLNPASAIIGLALFHEGFRWFESASLGGFPMYAYLLIVFLPLQLVLRRVVGYRREVRRLPARSLA